MIPRKVMEKIKMVEVEGDKVYLRKDYLGWRVVHPDKIILGDKRNLLMLGFLLLMALMFFLAYKEISDQMQDMIANPCAYSYFQNTSCINYVPNQALDFIGGENYEVNSP